MKIPLSVLSGLCCALLSPSADAANAVVLGWNNLGMHCMDSSYSEFSILPPYNTIEAQLIVGGKLVKTGTAYRLTYEAIADPDGSKNTTSVGKGNWAEFAPIIYGAVRPFSADQGLAGWNMPGLSNIPQAMLFENLNAPVPGVTTLANWFRAEGIPITPYDDTGKKNPYPMMRITARNASNVVIATSDIVLPVSDEMDCRVCHGANAQAAAMPTGGWIENSNKDREYRLNILKLHDDREFAGHGPLYADALAAKGYDPSGLYATTMAGKPILCAACHSSEALGTASFSSSNGTVPPLTSSVHTKHAAVMDPVTKITLNDSNNRSACYRCHPGSDTRCLRGTMGNAIASDGSMAMQCQSCHGNMAQVGASTRVGWFMEPKCQSCHTGNALRNSGAIRYTSVFDSSGAERVAADQTFATTPNTPAAGISLYRFSVGHGGLQCSACHGSTHAEFPASHRNDNIRNVQLQGHAGVMVECTACHTTMPVTVSGGPHGMHPVGQDWVNNHHDSVSQVGFAACQSCHGIDYKGTVLSRVQGQRSFTVGDLGKQSFYRGATIGCFTCHQGPTKSDMNWKAAPAIADVSAQTPVDTPVRIALPGNVTGVTLRVISQPQGGSVGIINGVATYYPYPEFSGTDRFTFSGYDGAKNSALATATITVGGQTSSSFSSDPLSVPVVDPQPSPTPSEDQEQQPATATAPAIVGQPVSQTVRAGTSVSFYVSGNGTGPLSYQWSKNGIDLPDATSNVLRLYNVTANAAGDYRVRLSNAAGEVYSNVATLTVQTPPRITKQPEGMSVRGGSPVTLSVSASSPEPLSYQWFKNRVPVANATSASLTIPSAQLSDRGAYYVRVSNSFGALNSRTVILRVARIYGDQ